MDIKKLYAHMKNQGKARKTCDIKYIVLHYTSNKTDKAVNNAKYFATNIVGASAHYFVDENGIYQSVADNVIAWSVGGEKYSDCSATGGGTLHGKVTNENSISIEMCSKNGAFLPETLNNAEELVRYLMAKYNIPVKNVVRHFDVNGKHCPGWTGWYGKKSAQWDNFKKRFEPKYAVVNTAKNNLPIRNSKGVKIGSVAKGKKVVVVKKSDRTMILSGKIHVMTKIQYGSVSGYVAESYLKF